ncbi:MAG: 3-deoxy-D-manno-octulosonic acid transferase [Alistipes sp.]|nr:3-deoxy-D-manno-octulosonic acid transferase [Alistipes sp.]
MWLYDIAIALYASLIRLVAPWNEKARLWSDGRKALFERMRKTVSGEKIVWIHAASLGEFEQGRPIIEAIRADYPEYKILLTFFSPSGYEIRKNYEGADFIFYLPADTKANVRNFLDIVKPQIAIFVKYEFWLNMLSELRRRRISTYIVSAIFRPNSVFFRPYGSLWCRALETFDTIFVQDENSQRLLATIGFDNVVVAGDTRFDRVAQIAAMAKRVDVIEEFKGENRLFVAGSTWGPDEDILLPLINDNPQIKFVIAPHEMEEERIGHILKSVKGGAVRYTQREGIDLSAQQVLVLDTIGILSSVYGSAIWAYIGGGFGVGIHNTLEAATFGLPIAFGTNYAKFKEAVDMVSLGAATSVDSSEALQAWFAPLRDDAEHLALVSRTAKEYTLRHQGATQNIVKHIFEV